MKEGRRWGEARAALRNQSEDPTPQARWEQEGGGGGSGRLR